MDRHNLVSFCHFKACSHGGIATAIYLLQLMDCVGLVMSASDPAAG